MNDIEIGWLAGIIDGEGSIVLDRKSKWRSPRIKVASTDIEILLECKRICAAGSITEKKSRNPKHSKSWVWACHSTLKTIEILKVISPYLKCPKKKRRAVFIIDNYNLVTPRNGYYTKSITIKKKAFEKEFYEL